MGKLIPGKTSKSYKMHEKKETPKVEKKETKKVEKAEMKKYKK